MSTIYSSLPNPLGDLGELKNEFAFLINFLNQKEIKSKVDFNYSQTHTVAEITTDIIAKQKEIRLFHFSGHSGVSGLRFTDAEFDDEHLIRFFNTICGKKSKIECVFLNGCENEQIVNKLLNVPIVIGTKSKIEDKTAGKFTQDFFSALIESENTYREAFNISAVAINQESHIVDLTRSERGIKTVEKLPALNDYFMVINKDGSADKKFSFNPEKANWTKYLVILFLVLALFIGFLFKDSIFRRIGGYSCDSIETVDGKCNFVIGDFATIPEMDDFNAWLFGNIRNAPIIQEYLHAINIKTFDNVIHNNSVDRDSLPSYCNYDFNLTGSITSEGNGLRAEFNVFPYITGTQSPGLFVYSVPSLGKLDSLISTLNEDNAQQFVLYEMCVSCALRKNMPHLPLVLQEMAATFDPSGSSEMFQRLQYSLAEVHLHYSDTTAALVALDRMNIASKDSLFQSPIGNDLALFALERKIDLYSSSRDLLGVYETQSELFSEMQARVQNPGQYQLKEEDVKQYEKGANDSRWTRASLVRNNPDGVLSKYQNVANRDFEYLKSIRYQSGVSRDFTQLQNEQIKADRITTDDPSQPTEQLRVGGSVFDETGKRLDGVIVIFGDTKKRTDAKGQFDFGTFNRSDVIGKQLFLSREGYQDMTIEINEKTIGKIVLTSSAVKRTPDKYTVNLQGVKINSTLYRKVLSSLKSGGHPINTQFSENFETSPENFAKFPTVVIYHEGNRERAHTIARQMKEWTKQNFEVVLSSSQPGKPRAPQASQEITIQWVNSD